MNRKNDKKKYDKLRDWLLAFYMFIFFFVFYSFLFYYFKKSNFLSDQHHYDYLIFGLIAAGSVIFLPLVSMIIRKIIDKELNQ